MSRTTTFLSAAAAALLAPAALSAQICQGFASFSNGPVQVGAALEFGDNTTVYGANIGFGGASGGFVRGEIASVDDDDSDASATMFGAQAGWQLAMGMTPSALQFCPVLGFSYLDGEGDYSANEILLGLSVGAMMSQGQTLSVAPFGAIAYRRLSQELGPLEADDNYGTIDLGVGFIANEWITIRPAVTIPFAEPDGFERDVSYGVRFAFNFGSTAR